MSDAKSIFAEMEAAVGVVSAKKTALDALTAQVQKASADYQEALKAAEAIHKTFANAMGAVIPSTRSR